MRLLPAVFFALATTTAAAQTTCDAHTYGAKGDGKTNDTAAIQKAIDACAPKHGTVILKGGTHAERHRSHRRQATPFSRKKA